MEVMGVLHVFDLHDLPAFTCPCIIETNACYLNEVMHALGNNNSCAVILDEP